MPRVICLTANEVPCEQGTTLGGGRWGCVCLSFSSGGLLTGSYALWNVYAIIVLVVHVQGAGGEWVMCREGDVWGG